MTQDERKPTAVVSSIPDDPTLAVVHTLLARISFDYISSSHLLGEESYTSGLRRLMSRADVLIAILGKRADSPAGLFEAGTAFGLGLPVLLVAHEGGRGARTPPQLREFPVLYIDDPNDLVARRFKLTLDSVIRQRHLVAPVRSTEDLTENQSRSYASAFEARAAEAFLRLGMQVVPRGEGNRLHQVDLAIWVPVFGASGFNPVLVEVAGKLADTKKKRAQLHNYLLGSESSIGIVLLPDGTRPSWDVTSESAVLSVGVEYLELVGRNPDDVTLILLEGRNRLIHQTT
jgi:hypothetical protein